MGNQIYYDYVILSIVPLTLMLANSDVICQTGANHLKRSPSLEQANSPEHQTNYLLDLFPNVLDFIQALNNEARQRQRTSPKRPMRKTKIIRNDLKYTLREFMTRDRQWFTFKLERAHKIFEGKDFSAKNTIHPEWIAETEDDFYTATIFIKSDGVSMMGTRKPKTEDFEAGIAQAGDEEVSVDLKIRNEPNVAKDIEYLIRDVMFTGFDLPR